MLGGQRGMFKYLEKVLYSMFRMKHIFFLSHFPAVMDDFPLPQVFQPIGFTPTINFPGTAALCWNGNCNKCPGCFEKHKFPSRRGTSTCKNTPLKQKTPNINLGCQRFPQLDGNSQPWEFRALCIPGLVLPGMGVEPTSFRLSREN